MALFPTNYHEHDDEPLGEPEENTPCQLSVSGCFADAEFWITWNGERIPVCAHCKTFAETPKAKATEDLAFETFCKESES